MTEQLKQALEALKVAEYRMRTSGDRHSDSYGKVEFAINTLERALTAAQPAQAGEVDERVAFEAWASRQSWFIPFMTRRRDMAGSTRLGQYVDPDMQAGWQAWQARASLPTQPAAQAGDAKCQTCNGHGLVGGHMQDGSGYGEGCPDCNPEPAPLVKWASTQPATQADSMGMPTSCGKPLCLPDEHHPLCRLHKPAAQATPEPVGEPDAWLRQAKQGPGVHDPLVILGAARPTGYVAAYRPVAYCDAHPAPGVPDVLFDGFAVLQALTPQAERRTSAENVSDVLDAAVRLIRAAQAKGGGNG